MILSQENIYVQSINRVINYVVENPTADLSLEKLAEIAQFSPFHFHRIFKSITNETLNQFVNRVRLTRAATLMRSQPSMTILDAAIASGYESAAGFSRAFKKHFGISPRQWNRIDPLEQRKINQVDDALSPYPIDELCNDGIFDVIVDTLPDQKLAYVRIYDSYRQWEDIVVGYEHLIDWYQGCGGDLNESHLYGMSHDDPQITPLEKCRFDWCVAVPEHWQGTSDISLRDFPSCRIAAIHAQGDLTLLDKAWQYLWRCWLPNSRYQPANLPALEIYHRLPGELGWETYDMCCAVPIIDL